jgi:hypothetical protein
MIKRLVSISVICAVSLVSKSSKIVCGAIKRYLVKRWSGEIISSVKSIANVSSLDQDQKNLAGLGGRSFSPSFVSWQELFDQSRDPELKRWRKHPTVVKECLFFAYFGPLEAWCENNCTGQFYLWSDETGIYRQFTNPLDRMLWSMTWDAAMPRLEELKDLRS